MKTVNPLKALYSLLFIKHRKPLIYATFFSVLTVLFSTGLMAFSAYIISFSALMPSIAEIMLAITIVRFLGIGRAVFRYVERLLSHNAVFLYLSQLRIKLYQSVSRLSGEMITNLNRKNAFHLLTLDIETLQDYFLRGILPLLSSILIWLIATVGLWQLHKIQALLFFVFYPISTIGVAWIINRITKSTSHRFTMAKKVYHSDFSSYVDFHSLLKWHGTKLAKRNAVNKQAQQTEQICTAMNQVNIISSNLQQILINLHILILIIVGIILIQNKALDGVWLATFVLATFSLYEAAPTVLNFFIKTDACVVSAANIVSFTSSDPNPPSASTNHAFKILRDEEDQLSSIHYDTIDFNYKHSDFKINFPSFSLETGKHIAIVGPSGSGKSSLAALLCGFYDEENYHDLADYFSVVNQDIYLFNDRFISNLFVKEDHPDLKMSLERSGLDPVFWTNTNPWIGEDGVRLSGGQRQRLGLARALLRDKPFLILDEAFSGLEREKENEIMHNLLESTNHTLIWITHRLTGMELMKEIYVMDQGNLVSRGTHEHLLRTCPLYQSMLNKF